MYGQERLTHEEQRELVWKYLDVGLVTEVEPRADTDEEAQAILARLRGVAGDIIKTLSIAGFYEAPVEHGGFDQCCETCVYFQVHRKHCDLPEIDLPVEPHWSCRLWRI